MVGKVLPTYIIVDSFVLRSYNVYRHLKKGRGSDGYDLSHAKSWQR